MPGSQTSSPRDSDAIFDSSAGQGDDGNADHKFAYRDESEESQSINGLTSDMPVTDTVVSDTESTDSDTSSYDTYLDTN